MFPTADPADHSPESLRETYERTLRETIETTGLDEAADASDLDHATVEALLAGDHDDLTVGDAASILAAGDDRDADAIAAEARDTLLLSMSSAVLDVDALARGLDRELTAKELQQKIEGRHPMTLAEYARLQVAIAEES